MTKKIGRIEKMTQAILAVMARLPDGKLIERKAAKGWLEQMFPDETHTARHAAVRAFVENDNPEKVKYVEKAEYGIYFLKPEAKGKWLRVIPSAPGPAPVVDGDSLKEERKKASGNLKEELFYDPLASELETLEECTHAVALGGASLGGRWGTPDVLGVIEPDPSIDRLKFSTEIVAVEVKSDADERTLIEGFGQACAYRAFSHKSYLAVPKMERTNAGLRRLESLCDNFGIGLIMFDATNKDEPDFSIHIRARSQVPSLSYVEKLVSDLRSSTSESAKKARRHLRL